MKVSEEILKKILLAPGFITETQFIEVAKEAKEENRPIEDILVEKDLISDRKLGELIADEFGYNFVSLEKEIISEKILNIVPELVARKQKIITFDQDKEGLKLAMANPENLEIIKLLEKKTGNKIIPYFATERDIQEALIKYRKDVREELGGIIEEGIKEIDGVKIKEAPIIRIVDSLLRYSYFNKASDIHIEPYEDRAVVRFRIDGILHDVITLPRKMHEPVVTRVKILSKLRTDEHQAAQDGRLEFKIPGVKEKTDVRVSIVPITKGEKIVLRILSERSRQFSLKNLGFFPEDFKKVKASIKKPWGMILATGPTGCGKTTTLYAILKILNKRELNIATIEDPVEYDIEGVNQIQVNPKTNLTFAKGLRAIVRQDPDIIMVGEIRDKETASIAINSAMTGHLVLSTLHTNDAATTFPRFLDMGIEPFLITSTINIVIAQRLVRNICENCKESYELPRNSKLTATLPQDLKQKLFKGKTKILLYRGKGCKFCNNTGYLGRIGIFEVLEMEENIKKLIMVRANAGQIQVQAIKNGMTTMFDDGIKKVLKGITTIEEVMRVVR